MLLTSKQVAEKLGVSRNLVTTMAREGRLPSVPTTHQTPSGRANYEFDSKAVREFQQTFTPPAPRIKKAPKTNGHAPEFPLPLDIPTLVALNDRLLLLIGRCDRIEDKVTALMAAWGVEI